MIQGGFASSPPNEVALNLFSPFKTSILFPFWTPQYFQESNRASFWELDKKSGSFLSRTSLFGFPSFSSSAVLLRDDLYVVVGSICQSEVVVSGCLSSGFIVAYSSN